MGSVRSWNGGRGTRSALGKAVPSQVHKVYKAETASITLDPLNWEALPTLYNVIPRVAGLPIYEALGIKVVEASRVPGVSSSRRID